MDNLNYGSSREVISGKDASGSVASETSNVVEKTEEGGGLSLIFIIIIVIPPSIYTNKYCIINNIWLNR